MKADVRLTKAFYSPGEVAALLGLHPDTILKYVHAGRLAAIQLSARTYRIPQREVRRVIDGEGIVFIHGENWRALSQQKIPAGTKVRVVSVEALKLRVEPVSTEAPPSSQRSS